MLKRKYIPAKLLPSDPSIPTLVVIVYVPSQLLLLVDIDKDHSRLNCNVVCQPRLTSNS